MEECVECHAEIKTVTKFPGVFVHTPKCSICREWVCKTCAQDKGRSVDLTCDNCSNSQK